MATFATTTAIDAGIITVHWTVDRLMRAAEIGLFDDLPHLELIEGQLVQIVGEVTPTPPHGDAIQDAMLQLARVYGLDRVRVQQPLFIAADSIPEPDVAVMRTAARGAWPRAADVVLVVEVSNASLYRDRYVKRRLYAGAGIAEYWLINLVENVVEQYMGLNVFNRLHAGDTVRCPETTQQIAVEDLLRRDR